MNDAKQVLVWDLGVRLFCLAEHALLQPNGTDY